MSYFGCPRSHTDGRTRTLTKVATKQTDSGTTTGYEGEMWAMADTLRGSMLVAVLREQEEEGTRHDAGVAGNLEALGFGGES